MTLTRQFWKFVSAGVWSVLIDTQESPGGTIEISVQRRTYRIRISARKLDQQALNKLEAGHSSTKTNAQTFKKRNTSLNTIKTLSVHPKLVTQLMGSDQVALVSCDHRIGWYWNGSSTYPEQIHLFARLLSTMDQLRLAIHRSWMSLLAQCKKCNLRKVVGIPQAASRACRSVYWPIQQVIELFKRVSGNCKSS